MLVQQEEEIHSASTEQVKSVSKEAIAPFTLFLTTSVNQTHTQASQNILSGSPSLRPQQPLRRLGVLFGVCLLLTLFGSLGVNSSYQASGTAYIPPAATQPPATQTTTSPIQQPATAPQQNKPQPVVPPPIQILVQDNFQRADQTFWGTASDGRHDWQANASNSRVFSITGQTGTITDDGNNNTYDAIIGSQVANSTVLFTGMLTNFTNANTGSVLRWQDTNNWYKAYIDGSDVGIKRDVNGAITKLTTTLFTAQPGVFYSIRFRAVGHTLQVRAWQSDQGEPANWMLTIHDNTFSSGHDGLRVALQQGIQAAAKSYEELSA